MVEINPTVASHKLNTISTAKPVRQKVRRLHSDRHQITQPEILTKSRFSQISKVPQMASQRIGGSKEGRQVASMYRLH